ncbi:aspartate/glutamate racemase family protein [Mucilaginibacter glaciei]|uniref:Amino acid racemase n=1 Tax=Mucilaginibacter glaciei TaxID=2772109 RepID=A0A926NUL8_9SPHI|nr:amino acid racemase [Mucilaginibacter glaciei]MBD1392068.1 amino acid racemase [Mucilaginibacter glaciei]
MKILGLLGGTSWVSTVDYYRFINQEINDKLGGVNAAHLLLHSFNYADIGKHLSVNDWDAVTDMMVKAGKGLRESGAEAIVLCANTMHLIAPAVEREVGLPVIHIAVATAKAINRAGIKTVALLGTRFTMERDFFINKLKDAGIDALLPEKDDRDFIHQTLVEELGKGITKPETKERYLSIIENLRQQGAVGVILGCTEIPLLIQPADTAIIQFDTTRIHSSAAVEFALS